MVADRNGVGPFVAFAGQRRQFLKIAGWGSFAEDHLHDRGIPDCASSVVTPLVASLGQGEHEEASLRGQQASFMMRFRRAQRCAGGGAATVQFHERRNPGDVTEASDRSGVFDRNSTG